MGNCIMQAVEKVENPDGIRLCIFLQPKTSRDQIIGLHDGELKIAITSPPVEGAANAHLLKYLSKLFKVPKSSIVLEKGELQRHKQIFVPSPKLMPKEIEEFLA